MNKLKTFIFAALGLFATSNPTFALPSPTAELNRIQIASVDRNTQFEISGDKPLTYTFYKVSPRVAVIDIAAAVPSASFIIPEKMPELFNKITIEKREQQALVLTRIIFDLDHDNTFTVQSSPENKGKLLATFSETTQQTESSQTAKDDLLPTSSETTIIPVAAAEIPAATLPPATENMHQAADTPALTAKPVEQGETTIPGSGKVEVSSIQVDSVDKKEPIADQKTTEHTKEAPESSIPNNFAHQRPLQPVIPEKSHQLKGSIIELQGDIIAIATGNLSHQHKIFKLKKPNRLVVDIAGLKCPDGEKEIKINRLGIRRARIGSYPDKTRIVFDIDGNFQADYQIGKKEDGLVLQLKR